MTYDICILAPEVGEDDQEEAAGDGHVLLTTLCHVSHCGAANGTEDERLANTDEKEEDKV